VQRVTVSAGLALFPEDATTRAELLDTAEAALYLVRQTGGNRLGLADAEARETLQLRHTLEQMVQASLAESGSAETVQHLIAEAAGVSRSSRHATLAEQLTTEALRALAAAIDAKDDYTRGHSERVAATATEIARCMGMPLTQVEHVTTAARMHDIGKIGVPDHILHKGSALTPEEQAIVATHPDVGARILAPIHTLREVVPIVRHHHEHYDGNGYPLGLCGEDIPPGARVVAVADAIDAMITDRPYRRGMPITVALTELQRWAGSHYDPRVVATAVQLYGPGGTGLALRGVLPAARATRPSDGEAAAAITAPLSLVLRSEPAGTPAEFALRAIVRGDAETARPVHADIPH
jgi:putative nucleotidyltransferase with HDIG domain